MQKSALLAAIQQEIQRHDFSHFVENPPSVADGGKGGVAAPPVEIESIRLASS